MKQFLLLGCLIALLQPLAAQTDEVIYHVVQRSFYDSNGDSQGDLEGLRLKLDYLQELGVTSVLLLPLYASDYYHNYFSSDFESIDPEFGEVEDYLALIRDMHERGMKLYMDMETQYITEDHLWYRDSYKHPGSSYSNYLIYNGDNNTDPESIIFNIDTLGGFDGTKKAVTTVNLLSPEVLQYNIDLFRHWVDPNGDGNFEDGVDGFRLDHMMDDLDWKGRLTHLFEQFWSPLISSVKEVNPEVSFIAEQARWESWGTEYLDSAHVDHVFAFNLFRAMADLDKERIMDMADSTFSLSTDTRDFIVFIENHDIKRFASQVGGDAGKLKVGAALNLLIGGTPSIYYGQEIGMKGDGGFGKFGMTDGNDIPMREAFEWYTEDKGKGLALWYQDTGPWWDQRAARSKDGISLAEQHDDPGSLWNTYRALLALRKQYPALINGQWKEIPNENPHVVSFLRMNDWQKIIVLINVSGDAQEMESDLAQILPGVNRATSVYGSGLMRYDETVLGAGLPPYGVLVVWMR